MMTKFLWKGIVRDRSRSLLPIIVVAIGVFFVVVMNGVTGGMLNNMIRLTANHTDGHLRVMTKAYQEEAEMQPLELSLLGVDTLLRNLNADFTGVSWTPRILFGGLIDVPDATGNTRVQGPVAGTACDFLTANSQEFNRMGLDKAIISGQMIDRQGEILISADFSDKFSVKQGDTVTFFGSTMYGAMAFMNFEVCGVVRFGIGLLDKGAVIMDITDARRLLDMDDAANHLLGFFKDDTYEDEKSEAVKSQFESKYRNGSDDYAPIMVKLTDNRTVSQILGYMQAVTSTGLLLIIFALAIVLWNTGILGGIRRYSEFGVRLAIGEHQSHIYKSLLLESLMIGLAGSVVGTVLGVLVGYYLQYQGIDYSKSMENVSMVIDPVIRAEVTPQMYFIGFLPGVLAMLLGSALAGRAIYKRSTANLFKELD